MSCSASGCTKRHIKGSSINFFRFPLADNDRLKIWLQNVKRKNWTPSSSSRLCSTHFEEDQFFIDKEGKRRLKDTAIPTIFVFQSHWLIQEEIAMQTRLTSGLVSLPDPPSSLPSCHPLPVRTAEPAVQLNPVSDYKPVPKIDSRVIHNYATVKKDPPEKTKAVDPVLQDDIVKVVVYDDDDVFEVITDDKPACTTSRGTQTASNRTLHDHTYRRVKEEPVSVCSSDHNYIISDSPRTLKRKAEVLQDKLVLVHKKLKLKCQQTRRLESRLSSMTTLTKDLKKKLKAVEKNLLSVQKQGRYDVFDVFLVKNRGTLEEENG